MRAQFSVASSRGMYETEADGSILKEDGWADQEHRNQLRDRSITDVM